MVRLLHEPDYCVTAPTIVRVVGHSLSGRCSVFADPKAKGLLTLGYKPPGRSLNGEDVGK
nr:MAG: hypothetical protein H1BulkLitter41490_000002 [Mitovirus sp.]